MAVGVHMRALVVLALGGFLLAVAACDEAAAERHRIGIHVLADPTKANGKPWDFADGPPDLMACVFGPGGLEGCLTNPHDRRFSACHDSYDCDWSGIDVPRPIVGIVTIDLDIRDHDFVDAVILVDKAATKQDPGADAIETAMRSFIAAYAPADRWEQARRDRPFQRFTRSDCERAACKLRQSRIRVERTD